MLNETKKIQVYEILLKPISCSKNIDKIFSKDEKIFTGQKYYSNEDEDMSDFAIGFYEIVYSNILGRNSILDENGYLVNKEFAGDTMNSFNSIANITPNVGKEKGKRPPEPEVEWPKYLQDYYSSYHCLANFWILPMSIGRRSAKLNKYDSTDLFLNILNKDFTRLSDKYNSYFGSINKYEDYCDIHFIKNSREESVVQEMYNKKNSKMLVENAMNDIKARAYRIVESVYASDLWDYFYNLRLICCDKKD